MTPTKLILIRHGITDWNEQKKYSGFMDISLNARGKTQARRLHKRLKVVQFHKIYCSDRKRAIQTAKIIFKGMGLKKVPSLKEIGFGCFEGYTYDELLEKYPIIYKKWLDTPSRVKIPKAEKQVDFRRRVLKAFKRIVSLNQNKTIAVVCHGGPISIFINSILKTNGFWKYIPASASLTIVEYKRGKPQIRVFNDTRHLK